MSMKKNQLSENLSVPSNFNQILDEIDTDTVPPKYIGAIELYYNDGTSIDIPGAMLDDSVNVKEIHTCKNTNDADVIEAKVFIDTEKLENDVNELVEQILGKWC